MEADWRFPILIVVSLAAFVGVLLVALNRRRERPAFATIGWVAALVVVCGMLFAKIGATLGLPVWLYYGVPAVVTWLLPPLVFRMRASEVATYLPLAVLAAPVIHVVFSLVLGWNEYMPFISVPTLKNLM